MDTVDQINALDVFKGDPKEEEWMRDLVRLRIEALDAQNLMDSGVEDTKGRVLRFFDNGTAGGTPTVAKTIPLLINDFRMVRRGIEIVTGKLKLLF